MYFNKKRVMVDYKIMYSYLRNKITPAAKCIIRTLIIINTIYFSIIYLNNIHSTHIIVHTLSNSLLYDALSAHPPSRKLLIHI